MRRPFKLLGIATALALLAGGVLGFLGYRDYQRFLGEPLRVTEGEFLTVDAGRGVASLAEELERRGAIRSAPYLKLHVRLHPETAAIQAGDYTLSPTLTPATLLAKLNAGDVSQFQLTIPEGWTVAQMLAAVREHPHLEHTLDEAQLRAESLLAALGLDGVHAEGLFFPDTYRFPRNTSDRDFLLRAYQTMQRELDAAWRQCEARGDVPLDSPYQALTMASIIERETGQAGERRQISGVFARRLRRDMRLQTDPTVIYGLGDSFDGNLRRRDLQTDTPYNTYTRHGLPPTPIALPGRAALQAACDPADGSALYFVADGDGGHVFADTLQAHNRNVREYQLKQP